MRKQNTKQIQTPSRRCSFVHFFISISFLFFTRKKKQKNTRNHPNWNKQTQSVEMPRHHQFSKIFIPPVISAKGINERVNNKDFSYRAYTQYAVWFSYRDFNLVLHSIFSYCCSYFQSRDFLFIIYLE